MASVPEGKISNKCEEWKRLEEFTPMKIGRYGRNAQCKACRSLWKRAYNALFPDRIQATNRKQYEKTAAAQIAAAREWRRAHPEKWAEHARNYRANNPDRAREWTQRYRDANRDKERERSQRYRQSNLEASRERSRMAEHRRRARKLGSGGSFTTAEWHALCDLYGNHCLCCGQDGGLTPDHVVPLARGGSNDSSNIQPLCLSCNLRKGTKIIDDRPFLMEDYNG